LFILIFRQLGNHHLQLSLFVFSLDRPSNRIAIEVGRYPECNAEFDLYPISLEALSLIDRTTLESIVSSDDLQIESEDWLLNLIGGLDNDYSKLNS
jgi:hypothetical protein